MMSEIEVSYALGVVRSFLDEQGLNESVMYGGDDSDNPSLDLLVAKLLPRAINEVHKGALPEELEGEDITDKVFPKDDSAEPEGEPASENDEILAGDDVLPDSGDDVLPDSGSEDLLIPEEAVKFTIPEDFKFLRLVRFKSSDSPLPVTEIVSEASPEGRKQLNKHIRGNYEKPRLVLSIGNRKSPSLTYYCTKARLSSEPAPTFELSVISRQEYSEDATSYSVSSGLEERVCLHLTSLILGLYGEYDKAKYFEDKASQN